MVSEKTRAEVREVVWHRFEIYGECSLNLAQKRDIVTEKAVTPRSE
jgi:adenylylsulfate kinase-like enzyme